MLILGERSKAQNVFVTLFVLLLWTTEKRRINTEIKKDRGFSNPDKFCQNVITECDNVDAVHGVTFRMFYKMPRGVCY
jgi:hypothetical protein